MFNKIQYALYCYLLLLLLFIIIWGACIIIYIHVIACFILERAGTRAYLIRYVMHIHMGTHAQSAHITIMHHIVDTDKINPIHACMFIAAQTRSTRSHTQLQ